jgi:hypothetical protein
MGEYIFRRIRQQIRMRRYSADIADELLSDTKGKSLDNSVTNAGRNQEDAGYQSQLNSQKEIK